MDRVLTGRRLGHHVILDCLGEGGMGTVYRAQDTRLGRTVALKIMRPGSLGDEDGRRRFLREATAASLLNHPGVVTIYEIDSVEGVDFIAMEYVAGPTLAGVIPTGGLSVDRALRLGLQLAEALAAAHQAGVVHRDLKPSNILIAPNDRVKVADFGVAKLVESATSSTALTRDGTLVGTPAYMSPEQASGGAVDARADLFSAGCVLYEMLTGRRPFAGSSAPAVIAAILRDAPAPLVGVPGEVSAIVERCLCKDPAGRFQSAADLVAAIQASVSGAASGSRDASIAVLPFLNMSGTRDDDYLCEGLAEEIINVLTNLPGLTVIARTSAFAAARAGLGAREIAARLGVSTVLEGSVRRAGARVRVNVQLIDSVKGAHVWSERYERELTDIFALEDEIAERVATRLRGDLAGAQPGRAAREVVPEAHQANLEGRYHFARGTADALLLARACYQRALARDPDFASAHESLAELYFFTGFFGTAIPRDAFALSAWHAARAIELDDRLPEAHALLATLRKELDYDWQEVHREFCRAFALSPASPVVRMRYAVSELLPLGRVDEGLRVLDQVLDADPLSIWMRFWVGVFCLFTRQPGRILAEGRRMMELDASHPLSHLILGLGYERAGDIGPALAALERANQLSGGLSVTAGFLAHACGVAGLREKARGFIARTAGEGVYVSPMVSAFACMGLEEWDAAIEWLDRAIEMRDPLVIPIKSYPQMDSMRQDPRFAGLLRKMNLE